MKKFMCLSLACLALLAFVAAPTFACDGGKTTNTSASTTTTNTDGKLASSTTTADGKACCAAHSMTTAAAADGKECPFAKGSMVNMSIKGMTCSHCESEVRASLEQVPGVMKVVSVSYKDGTALVCMDPAKCKEASLTSAVSNKGFEAQVIPAVATSTTDSKMKACAGMDKAACAKMTKAECAAKCAAAKDEKQTSETSTDKAADSK